MLVKNNVDMCKSGLEELQIRGTLYLIGNMGMRFLGRRSKNETLPRMIGSSPAQHDSIEMCVLWCYL